MVKISDFSSLPLTLWLSRDYHYMSIFISFRTWSGWISNVIVFPEDCWAIYLHSYMELYQATFADNA